MLNVYVTYEWYYDISKHWIFDIQRVANPRNGGGYKNNLTWNQLVNQW